MTRSIMRRALMALPLLALAGPLAAQSSSAPAASAIADTTGWGLPIHDIAPDPAVRFGTLPNGLHYAILRNTTPERAVVVRFGFDIGWVDEADDELGLAHFIEHMAFNGSTKVPEGEMIKLLEREGLAFGADTNASTGFEDTIYKLDLPRNDPELLDTALMLMRETASELTIAPEAVDRERGVIQSETRTRNTYAIRRIKHYLKFIAPETRYAARFRADGTNENVDGAPATRLKDLYARYYRPDNAALVIVGDIDPDAVQKQVEAHFASWNARPDPIADVDGGIVDLARGPAAANFVDPAVENMVVVDRFAEYRRHESTVSDFRHSLLSALGRAMLNRRFERIANAPDAPILSGGVSAGDFFELYDQSTMTLQAKEGEWQQALRIGEQEWRRAMEFGFTEAELAEQMANFTRGYRDAAEQQNTRRSESMATAILSTAKTRRLFVLPQTSWELFQAFAEDITPDMVADAFRSDYALGKPLIHVSSKQPIAGGEQTILDEFAASQAVAVTAPQGGALGEFGYTDFGHAGAIASDTVVADLGFREIRFANNVRLNLKRTDFEQNKVRFTIRIGSGGLSLPDDSMGTAMFLSSTMHSGGLGKHSFDELRQILAGRDVTHGLSVQGDQFSVAGQTTMVDLPLQMQLTAAYLSDPGFRTEALTRWQALLPPYLARADATPQSVAQFQLPQIITDNNPRFGIPAKEKLESVTLEAARAQTLAQLTSAPIEISVVGDIDEAAVIAAVASSFGALPTRQDKLEPFTASRQAHFTTRREPVTLLHAGAEDQALAQVYWPTTDDGDAQEEATLRLLATVMRLELLEEIREKLGASYSPGATSSMSDTFEGFGSFSVSVVVEPGQADAVFAVIDTIARSLRETPVDADLLDRARKPMLEQLALSKRENSYWLGVMSEAQLRASRLDRFRDYEARLRNVTPAMLQAAAARYLLDNQALRIRIVHKSLAPSE